MSKGIESIFITRQEILILLITEPIVVEGVPMVVGIRYSDPKLNHQNGHIVRGV